MLRVTVEQKKTIKQFNYGDYIRNDRTGDIFIIAHNGTIINIENGNVITNNGHSWEVFRASLISNYTKFEGFITIEQKD